MSRLPKEAIIQLAHEKGLLINDVHNYVNLQSELGFTCGNLHTFKCSVENLRKLKGCPHCPQEEVEIEIKNGPPVKTGFRTVGFDQATINFGVSVFDNEVLVYFDVLKFKGTPAERIMEIGKTISAICKDWEPDLIIYEDIQYQMGNDGYNTFKLLAELKGVVGYEINKANVKSFCVLNKVWQSLFNIKGRNRIEQKLAVIEKVKFFYPAIVDITDDAADAILIGKYGVMKRPKPELKSLF